MNISLEKIKETLGNLIISIDGDVPVEFPVSVTNDSRKADSNTVFVAIKGNSLDGHDFIPASIDSGCKVIVCSTVPESIPGVLFLNVSDSYSSYALLTEYFAGFPAEKLILAGVTGTNGKTTTAYLIKSILNRLSPCGLISTINYSTGSSEVPALRTTPDAVELQEMFSEMKDSGCKFAVMEVSSHSLSQNRIGSAKFAVAVFTNLSGDHLDYHKDMESYFHAKKILFEKHITQNGAGLINIDDPYGKKLYESLLSEKKVYSYGIDKNADFRIKNLSLSLEKTDFNLILPHSKHIKLTSPLCGRFNAYNIAAASAAAYLLDVEKNDIVNGVSEMTNVPGRMEQCSTEPAVFVDYAHTDDALENVLSTFSALIEDQKLTVVFGCGGDRDRSKRPRMAAVVAKFADKIIVTSDNPRSEDPERILDDIIDGIPENSDYIVIPDRKKAIISALENSNKKDVIIIAGKGHETYQEINGVKHPFDDRKVVKGCFVPFGLTHGSRDA